MQERARNVQVALAASREQQRRHPVHEDADRRHDHLGFTVNLARRHAVDQTVDCLDGNAAETDKSTTAFVREARMELRP
jgi:hypothetical protein